MPYILDDSYRPLEEWLAEGERVLAWEAEHPGERVSQARPQWLSDKEINEQVRKIVASLTPAEREYRAEMIAAARRVSTLKECRYMINVMVGWIMRFMRDYEVFQLCEVLENQEEPFRAALAATSKPVLPMAEASQCDCCRQRQWIGEDGRACDAFPDGIPQDILLNGEDHRTAYVGDSGARFKPKDQHAATIQRGMFASQ